MYLYCESIDVMIIMTSTDPQNKKIRAQYENACIIFGPSCVFT